MRNASPHRRFLLHIVCFLFCVMSTSILFLVQLLSLSTSIRLLRLSCCNGPENIGCPRTYYTFPICLSEVKEIIQVLTGFGDSDY